MSAGATREPKVPYRQVGAPEGGTKSAATKGGGTGAKGGGTGAKGGEPKVPYRQASGAKGSPPATRPAPPPADPVRRTPGSKGTGARVTVTVDDAHLDDVEGLAERLRAEGLEVDEVLGDIGVITGSVAPDKRRSIDGFEGVAGVEEEATFQLPPPEAGIQ